MGSEKQKKPSKKKEKPPKVKLVRDSYTIPKDEHASIEELKQRCLSHGMAAKKSEILRAGLRALNEMDNTALLDIMTRIERIKTGRPKQQ